MNPDQDFVNHLLELMEDIPDVTAKRMFGGYGIFREDLMFGLVADSTLYLKVDAKNKTDFEERGLGPFTFETKTKPIAMSYHLAPGEALDNAMEMRHWAESAFAAARRAKKKAPQKTKKKKTTTKPKR